MAPPATTGDASPMTTIRVVECEKQARNDMAKDIVFIIQLQVIFPAAGRVY
jgi:hypothetical protein